ncbi:ABC-2 type transport system ATP-binding protein [Asanoa hainanensis]|uniref:ABC-2 type transport system ATP-binding protein n=1 Tax=Asanoa hainanensis TaxID=560556 RepID=A0A239N2T7_9ACTN|nr:ATP-binding cassette domain-containing protein [Asanoa hainanensis]SNT48498.1 ABC-2 type transport system ATP-binding protein [Asanoa hainanensis]
MTGPIISARDLVKTYRSGVRALDGLSFDVREGTLFGLLGPNGAGKSTAVRILSTLSRPDAGEALVAGYDVTRTPREVRRRIGLVGQKLSAVPTATVRENVMLQGRMYGLRSRELAGRTDDVLARLGLAEVAAVQAGTCSGGMKRRIDIAMGIVHRPRILFLDEPTTGLDPDIRQRLWADLADLVRRDGLTILLTTHYLEEADELANQVAIIDRGRIVTTGSPEQLKQQLRGDTLRIELTRAPRDGVVGDALSGLGGVSEITVDGTRLHARADDGGAAVPVVLDSLARAGIAVVSVTVARPSLDDVYLRHTGRRYETASAAVGPTIGGLP